MNTIEGGLSILWENYTQLTTTPRYRLLFTRYVRPQDGAAPAKHIVGTAALGSYLVKIGLTPNDAKHWIEQVHQKHTVAIPRIWMPEEELTVYEQYA
jgi:hypothetical protein